MLFNFRYFEVVGRFILRCAMFQEGPQRKKRKSEAVQVEEKADLLAMGTAAGTVLIYSAAKGALHCTLVSLTTVRPFLISSTNICIKFFISYIMSLWRLLKASNESITASLVQRCPP